MKKKQNFDKKKKKIHKRAHPTNPSLNLIEYIRMEKFNPTKKKHLNIYK